MSKTNNTITKMESTITNNSNQITPSTAEPLKPYSASKTNIYDPDEQYRLTQSRILSLQETILDSTRNARLQSRSSPERSVKKLPSVEDNNVIVDSSNILNFTRNVYKIAPRIIKYIRYNPYGYSKLDEYNNWASKGKNKNIILENALTEVLEDFPPFLPNLSADYINKIISVYIPAQVVCQFINHMESNKRWRNSEIWGTDVYTDDSDILLVLSHLGVFQISDISNEVRTHENSLEKTVSPVLRRTPVNLNNMDDVVGTWDSKHSEQIDLIVNILILETLIGYQGSKRFGLRSRDWFGVQEHDGLSYGVYSIEFRKRSDFVTVSSWV